MRPKGLQDLLNAVEQDEDPEPPSDCDQNCEDCLDKCAAWWLDARIDTSTPVVPGLAVEDPLTFKLTSNFDPTKN
jgi:hypothetical protein